MKSFAVSADGSVGVVVLFDSSISVWDLNKMQAEPPTLSHGPVVQCPWELVERGLLAYVI